MAIEVTDIAFYRSALWPDLRGSVTPAQNGGRLSSTAIVHDTKNNVFPDVTSIQRAAGTDQYRKLFAKVNKNGETLTVVRLSLEQPTPGDSYVLAYAGTQTDTQDAVTGRPYGIGTITAIAGDTVTIETEADFSGAATNLQPFQAGDTVRLDMRATVAADGVWEFAEIESVAYDATEVTIVLTAAPSGAYDAGGVVASAIEHADLVATASSLTASGSLTYDAGYLTVPNLGAIRQTWTVTVTNASTGALSVSGDTVGSVGTGATGATLAPLNPATGSPYFSLAPGGWGGTLATGNTLTFTTTPAAAAVWLRRVVPAGAEAISDDPVTLAVYGETA